MQVTHAAVTGAPTVGLQQELAEDDRPLALGGCIAGVRVPRCGGLLPLRAAPVPGSISAVSVLKRPCR